jgi:hypothetical protein
MSHPQMNAAHKRTFFSDNNFISTSNFLEEKPFIYQLKTINNNYFSKIIFFKLIRAFKIKPY